MTGTSPQPDATDHRADDADRDAAGDAQALGEAWHDVEAAQTGDRMAFERLYRRYARIVHGIVLAHAPWGESEDLVQEVFFVAWARLGELRDPPAFGGWLAQIARRRAIDGHRRRRVSEPLEHEPGATSSDPTDALAILGVVRSIAPAFRETLVLRFVQGMTGPEIALELGMTAGSVRVNLHRGMAMLRKKLGERHGDG
jgi:RNA polymerase sigma-70 factor (ECF subfamily)